MKLASAIVLVFLSSRADAISDIQLDDIMKDTFTYWNMFRDGSNGFWCDSVGLNGTLTQYPRCGNGNARYSSAGTGVGLVSDCIQAELGLISRETAQNRVLQTIASLLSAWPREKTHGFFVHFLYGQKPTSEYSTIDTAEMTAGALFAGNYFGGEVSDKAEQLFALTDWQQALKSATDPTIFPVVNATSGQMGGVLKPFNEYYIVAYMAKRQKSEKASQYFETFFGTTGKPVGAQGFPKVFNYWGYELQTDHGGAVSSFIPQFCYFLTKGYQKNPYHMSVYRNWLAAELKFWDLAMPDDAQVWGKPVKGYVFGSGAGPDPTGYTADQIDNDRALTFSLPIMAGFLPAADAGLRTQIVSQIRHLYDNDICAYKVDGVGKVLWRCSVKYPEWAADHVDSIDFSTMIFGYASLFLPSDFYSQYAMGAEDSAVVQIV